VQGMYVVKGAKDKLAKLERQKFLTEEWPQIASRIERLGLELDDLPGLAALDKGETDGDEA